jgi:hypothetical protein
LTLEFYNIYRLTIARDLASGARENSNVTASGRAHTSTAKANDNNETPAAGAVEPDEASHAPAAAVLLLSFAFDVDVFARPEAVIEHFAHIFIIKNFVNVSAKSSY